MSSIYVSPPTNSALKDNRFDPIEKEEFENLHCEVSILMNFEMGLPYNEWQVGFSLEKGRLCTSCCYGDIDFAGLVNVCRWHCQNIRWLSCLPWCNTRVHHSVTWLTTNGFFKVGLHGIRIFFKDDRGIRRSATYLPDVVSERGWNQLEAIDMLIHKAGYKDAISEDMRQSIKLTRYQTEECCVSFEEYANRWWSECVCVCF